MVLSAFAVIVICVITWWVSNTIKANKENLNVDVNGKIQYVDYDIKGFPTLIIHNRKVYIGSGYNVNHEIQLGDSLIKKKGSTVYKLVKYNSGEVVEFTK